MATKSPFRQNPGYKRDHPPRPYVSYRTDDIGLFGYKADVIE